MAAIAYPVKGGQTRDPQRLVTRRGSSARPLPAHLHLVEAPLFAEPIFDELTTEALAGQASTALWSEPEVQLPRHQIVTEFGYSNLLANQPLSTRVLPAVREVREIPKTLVSKILANQPVHAVVPAPITQTVARHAPRYRIRRLVVCIALSAVMYGAFSGASALAGTHQGAPVAIAGSVRVQGGYEYTVRLGDTLWSIASRVYPSGDPRPLVAQLSAELDGQAPQPGQHLLLP